MVGSNIFNLLFVLGVTAAIRTVAVPEPRGGADLVTLALFPAVMPPLSRSHGARIVRLEGVGLVVAYLGYGVWRLGS